MLEGDDSAGFGLFAGPCGYLESCGVVSPDVSKAVVEEFSTYVVEKRRYHAESDRVASEIPNVDEFLLQNFGFKSRHHMLQIVLFDHQSPTIKLSCHYDQFIWKQFEA